MELKNGSTTKQEIDKSAQGTTTFVSSIPPQSVASGSLSQVSGRQTASRSMPWMWVLQRPASQSLNVQATSR